METKNEKVNHAKAHLSHLGYGTGTNFTVQAVAVLMVSYANSETSNWKKLVENYSIKIGELNAKATSQKETIERLREALQNVTSSLIAHIGRERAKEWLEVQQAEQLLNTTEPELDEQQKEYKEVEERTERNANVISYFMEHCKEEGMEIPDNFFESYFNA